jgi:glutamate synthase domain-containing protein 3
MSGGIAYVFDPKDQLLMNCNTEMVELEPMEDSADIAELKQLIEDHLKYTNSTVAKAILTDWESSLKQFVKVMPTDYKRALKEMAIEVGACD